MKNYPVGNGLTCQGTLCDIYFMGNIFQSLEKGDCVVGVITQIMESGLVMTILSLDDGKSRDIDNLRISVRPAWQIEIISWRYLTNLMAYLTLRSNLLSNAFKWEIF